MIDTLRERYRQWKVNRRRKKLLNAYAEVGKAKHDLGPGFSPLIYALSEIEREGFGEVGEDGELVWNWPEDGEH